MLLQQIHLQVLVYPFCGHSDRRLRYDDQAVRHRWKWCKDLSYSLRECRTLHDTVRHICAELHSMFHELFIGKVQSKQHIHRLEGCRCISASPCHSGCNRYVFIHGYMNTLVYSIYILHHPARLVYDVILHIRQLRRIRCYNDLVCGDIAKCQFIPQIDRLHDHLHLMISILASPDHVETEVYLSICL